MQRLTVWLRALRDLLLRAHDFWRRSLRARVVGKTVALCLVVVALLGTILISQVRDGLLSTREETSLAEAGAGTASAQREFDALDAEDPDARDRVALAVVERLATAGGLAGGNDILLIGSAGAPTSGPAAVDYSSGLATRDNVPSELRATVQRADNPALTYVELPVARSGTGEADEEKPGLAVGQRVFLPGAGSYELYFLFPLDQERRTLALIQRATAVAGLLLVVLVGLIAWLVARQVVTPVRMAARIAERLAAGRLEERMHVRGKDDLARLARSFNKMAESLQGQIGQLEDLSRMQRRFVSDVSHELRTPLTTVRMAADVLHDARDTSNPQLARSSELLQSQLEHFETLLTELLEISRFDAGAAVLEAEPHDLRTLVRRVAASVEPLADRRESEVRIVASEHPCVVDVDSRRIERILRNLVVNAIEHGQGNPVVVTVAEDATTATVSVRDFGVGLSDAEAARVFDRFWRADPARARTTGGTGLGLSIALEDAHLHGGQLEARGVPGEGSRFRLTLPKEADAESPFAAAEGHQSTNTSGTGGAPMGVAATPISGSLASPIPIGTSSGGSTPGGADSLDQAGSGSAELHGADGAGAGRPKRGFP